MKKIFTLVILIVSAKGFAQNVGIGNPTPTEKLHIDSGNIKIGNSIWSSPTNDKAVKFGDGDFVRIGESGADDRMELQAKDFIFKPSDAGYSGNVGIGTVVAPTAKLEVNGNVKITDGTEGANKVLTSDASGIATWRTPGSDLGYKKLIRLVGNITSDASGSFTVPAGVTEIMVECWGSGSGGTSGGPWDKMFGGTSGGYARTIQAVTPGQVCNYSFGTPSIGSTPGIAVIDGGNTTFNFASTFITAFGGRGRNANPTRPGEVGSGTGTVSNLFILPGNTGQLPNVQYMQKSATIFVEVQHFGDGGQTPGIEGAPIPKGSIQYLENGTPVTVVNDASSVYGFPGSGAACALTSASRAGPGMIIIWYN